MKNDRGFTLIGSLIRLVIISITLPILLLMLAKFTVDPNIESMSIQQFFFMLQNEVNITEQVSYSKEQLNLITDEEIITIERYGGYIRRRVNYTGNEIYHRNIKRFLIEEHERGIMIQLTMNSGDIYERVLVIKEE